MIKQLDTVLNLKKEPEVLQMRQNLRNNSEERKYNNQIRQKIGNKYIKDRPHCLQGVK